MGKKADTFSNDNENTLMRSLENIKQPPDNDLQAIQE